MTLQQKRVVFYTILLLILLAGPYTVLVGTDTSSLEVGSVSFYNVLQRVQMVGASGLGLHVLMGILTFFLVLLHPFFYVLIANETNSLGELLRPDLSDPFSNYVSLGSAALILILTSLSAGYFRAKFVFRRIWRRLHVLNYIIYVMIVLHAMGIGTDFMRFPFIIIYIASVPMVIVSFAQRVYDYYQTSFVS